MSIERIDDPSDDRLADYRDLTDVALRRVLEPAGGLYMAESAKVLRRALDAGHEPRSVMTAQKWLAEVEELLRGREEVSVYLVADEVAERVTGYAVHRGMLAAMHRPEPVPVAGLLAAVHAKSAADRAESPSPRTRSRIAVLEDLVDHTNVGCPKVSTATDRPDRSRRSRIAVLEGLTDHANVGSAFRNAAAMGVDAVLVTPNCADPLYRRSVRVSMGTVFQVPWTRIEDWPTGGIQLLKDAGYVVAGMSLGEDSITLDELVAEDHDALALVFGSEGHGLSKATDRQLDRRVTIPMMNGVDSLNVAASSAVAFYATR